MHANSGVFGVGKSVPFGEFRRVLIKYLATTTHTTSVPPSFSLTLYRHAREVEQETPEVSLTSNEQGLPRGWKAITVLLELLQDTSTASVTDPHLLVPHMFALLSRCGTLSLSLPLILVTILGCACVCVCVCVVCVCVCVCVCVKVSSGRRE